MGRHVDPRTVRRPSRQLVLAAAAVVAVLAAGLVWSLRTPADAGTCRHRQTVALTVAPEIASVAERLLAEPQDLGDGACAIAEVTAQAPLQTVAYLGSLDPSALPRVWVPDSSLWATRAKNAPLQVAGSFATSPVVLATSRAVADELGWTAKPPSWSAALSGQRPLAVPDLAASAEGLAALAAVRSSLGNDAAADNAVVQAVLAATRSTAVPGKDEALTLAADNSADAPLVPVSEQQVLARNTDGADPGLVAVYPSEGSPVLDYPVLRVGSPADAERPAVDAVVAALTSEAARTAVQRAGFRTDDGAVPPAAGPKTGTRKAAPDPLALEPEQVTALLGRLSSLAKPSRLLAVFDVSKSMEEKVGTRTRATLARDAAKSALTLFPDSTAIGFWVFAVGLDGGKDWAELVPIRTLDADAGGRTQRQVLAEQLDSIPQRLTPGGTGLYDTALAAVRAARKDYDPKAVSSVVIVTDGKDEDGAGIGREAFLQTLRAETDPARPVKVIGIALGPDADLPALQQIVDVTGGGAYSAEDPNDLQTVLFDALRRRN
jgi:Ca-activated chloride channel homolog